MSEQGDRGNFSLRGHNPDILTCIANLSNDEVFTPPAFANQMLDTLAAAWAGQNDGANIWADSRVTFLDPCTKSGVFLREITSRLVSGLAEEIPDLQQRVDHILTRQVFGVGITRLTAMLARRSLYCSKWATGKHSIARGFAHDDGNIWFERTEHTWRDGRCTYCGASQGALDRGDALESHAYALIHTDDVRAQVAAMFGGSMQFDVIIGNPPYQLSDDGFGTSAAPIYQYFVEQAKTLEPRFLSMIIPARWFAGGKGLDEFRESMLSDDRLRSIDDYLNASDVFPGVGLKGGICVFLWNRDDRGPCSVTTHFNGESPSATTRDLVEGGIDVFVRFNQGMSILRKVVAVETGQSEKLLLPDDKRFDRLVSSRKPFGLDTTFRGNATRTSDDDLEVYRNGGIGFVPRHSVETGLQYIGKWKIFTGYAAPGTGNKDTYPHRIISTPFLGAPDTISSETYLCIGPFDKKSQAESAISYLTCRLTRLLILLHKPSQHTTRKVYTFVPLQEWDRIWTDEMLCEKYELSAEDIAFIEKVVRPMEADSE